MEPNKQVECVQGGACNQLPTLRTHILWLLLAWAQSSIADQWAWLSPVATPGENQIEYCEGSRRSQRRSPCEGVMPRVRSPTPSPRIEHGHLALLSLAALGSSRRSA